MTQSLITAGLFTAGMLMLPLLLRWLQRQRHGALSNAALPGGSRLVSAVPLGPQQRVVTVEVGPEGARTWLVLGVTGQSITCLHALPAERAAAHG